MGSEPKAQVKKIKSTRIFFIKQTLKSHFDFIKQMRAKKVCLFALKALKVLWQDDESVSTFFILVPHGKKLFFRRCVSTKIWV